MTGDCGRARTRGSTARTIRRFATGFGPASPRRQRRLDEPEAVDCGRGRHVGCDLGGGGSVTAVRDGRSVDTTMGFSPLEGVPMATRSGSIDPEIVLHLLRTGRLALEEIEGALERDSGLLGLSGNSGRVEELEA